MAKARKTQNEYIFLYNFFSCTAVSEELYVFCDGWLLYQAVFQEN